MGGCLSCCESPAEATKTYDNAVHVVASGGDSAPVKWSPPAHLRTPQNNADASPRSSPASPMQPLTATQVHGETPMFSTPPPPFGRPAGQLMIDMHDECVRTPAGPLESPNSPEESSCPSGLRESRFSKAVPSISSALDDDSDGPPTRITAIRMGQP